MALADVPIALIEACRRDERAAIERLLRMISPDIYRIAFSMLRDHDDTDEVVQETLMRLFRHIKNLKEPERFAAWTMRIAVNQVQTWRVKKGRQRFYEFNSELEPEDGVIIFSGSQGGSPCDEAQRKEMRHEIEQAMADLPDRQQSAVVLFEIEGCSIKQIADAMACSEGAVKFNIHEARKKLKRRLSHLMQGTRKKSDAAPVKPRISKTVNS